MRNIVGGFAAILCIAIAGPALAQESETGGFSVGVTGGTLGIGPEVGYRMSSNLGVRANATFFDFSHDAESDGVEYDGDLELQSYGAMIDLYPFGGGFRVSGGARISKNEVGLVGEPTGDVDIGDDTFTAAEVGTLTGRVEADEFAPVATLGWAGGLTPGLKFGIDAGVMFQGTPRVAELSASGTAANRADFQAALADERAEIEEDLEDFEFYPVVQLSLGYRF